MSLHHQSLHAQSFHTQSICSRSLYRKPVCSRPHFFLALGGLLALAISTPALAQSVDIDADGSVRVDAGEGTVIEAGAAGTGVRTNGAAVEASGQVNNSRVKAGGDGVVHVIGTGTGGGRATTTINGRTITSSTESGGAVSYANQDLAGHNFAGMRLEGATFANSALQGASFRDAVLVGTSFANANLDNVDFRGANLQNATLTNAVLSGARFDRATWVDGRVCGSGSVGNCR